MGVPSSSGSSVVIARLLSTSPMVLSDVDPNRGLTKREDSPGWSIVGTAAGPGSTLGSGSGALAVEDELAVAAVAAVLWGACPRSSTKRRCSLSP